jgi:hypothetical protein
MSFMCMNPMNSGEAHSKVTSCKRGNFCMPRIAQAEGIQLRTLIRTPQEPHRQSRTGSLKKNWRLEAYVLWKDESGLFLHIIPISSEISGRDALELGLQPFSFRLKFRANQTEMVAKPF